MLSGIIVKVLSITLLIAASALLFLLKVGIRISKSGFIFSKFCRFKKTLTNNDIIYVLEKLYLY